MQKVKKKRIHRDNGNTKKNKRSASSSASAMKKNCSKECDPFVVFDLKPTRSRQVIVIVQRKEKAPFIFADNDEK